MLIEHYVVPLTLFLGKLQLVHTNLKPVWPSDVNLIVLIYIFNYYFLFVYFISLCATMYLVNKVIQ